LVNAACASKNCTLLACEQGVSVELEPQTTPGSYDIEVTIDDQRTVCTSKIDTGGALTTGCTRFDNTPVGGTTRNDDVYVLGSPGIRRLIIPSTTAKRIVVVVRREGAVVLEKDFVPAYTETPGPNGPDCDPLTCRLASTKL